MSRPARSVLDRIAEKFEISPQGCWEWTAAKTSQGYGKIGVGGKRGGWRLAYLVTWEETVGPVPDGFELDHLCRNRACINPDHLEPVTHAENMRRALTKMHCVRGHELTPENTYTYSYGRVCRPCQLRRSANTRSN